MAKNGAIVVGVNHYEHLGEAYQLKYAVHDAERMQEFLCKQAGFPTNNVLLCSDNSAPVSNQKIPTRPTRSNLRRLFLHEIKNVERADNFWFFYSGHGMLGRDNHDYLMPCDGYPRDVEETAISVDFVIRCLLNYQAKNIVMVLDMCRRSDGSKGAGDVGAYTAERAKQQGIVTIFSCGRGELSYELPELQQGAFTYALLEGLTQHGTPRALEEYLQCRVLQLNREYGKPAQIPRVSLLEPASNYDYPLLQLSKQVSSKDIAISNENLSSQPTPSRKTEDLNYSLNQKLVSLSVPGSSVFDFEVVMVDDRGRESSRHRGQAYYFTVDIGNGVTLEMVSIPGGTFLMGSPETEAGQHSNERPQHSVTVKSFLISKYPITKAQWREIASLPEVRQPLKLRPSRSGGKSHPITQVSWYDAVEFCARLSQKIGHEYRLPTEAEWEYACRAGTKTPFHFGETVNPDLVNYDGNWPYCSGPKGLNRKITTPVGSFQVANSFGLFDMHGNVWEWCLDRWNESYNNTPITGELGPESSENQDRVLRGGSWLSEALLCRSAYRQRSHANDRFDHSGFRIVRNL